MVPGDDKTCLEASKWLPQVVTCEVKKGFSCNGCRMPSLEKPHRLLEEKASAAVACCKEMPLLTFAKPIRWKIESVSLGRNPDNSADR